VTPEISVADTAELSDWWWAGALTLAERLPAPAVAGPGGAPIVDTGRKADTGPATRSTEHRLRQWQEANELSDEQFARRLAMAGIDAAALRHLLGESPQALAARVTRPGWVANCEQALALAPQAPGTRAPGSPPDDSWRAGFAWALRPFVALARDRATRLVAGMSTVDGAAVADGYASQLGNALAELAARTLVLELNVARVRGELSGDTGQQRFTDFVRRVATRAGLVALLQEYPVLARLVSQAAENSLAAHAELLARYASDRAAIVDGLLSGVDPGPLVSVRTGLGDGHRGGRSVALLGFADGRQLVYKPRPLDLHVHFGALLDWLNGAVPGLDLAGVPALARDGYGWLAYVAAGPCHRRAEVDRFYRRQGALLALLYALDAADVHYENLIACGDQPILVDIETLFHPELPEPGAVYRDPAADALARSVLRTHLLPQRLVGEHGTLDVSGLGGDPGGLFPHDLVGWQLPATDEMRLTRQPVAFSGARNRPRLDGRDQDVVDHLAALLDGFRSGYDAITRDRDGFLTLAARCQDDTIRIVPRPTQIYARLLTESTHPDLLRDALDRDRVLDLLWAASVDEPTRWRLVDCEIEGLWAGDIPLFTGRPGSRDVYAGPVRLPDLLDVAGLTAVRDKVAKMGEVDRREQEWLVAAAVATRRRWPAADRDRGVPGTLAPGTPDPARLLAAASSIADQIAVRALHATPSGADPLHGTPHGADPRHGTQLHGTQPHGTPPHADGRVNWVGLEPVEEVGWSVRPLGAGLAHGYCGVALFLAQIGALADLDRYRQLARSALRPVPALLDMLAAHPGLARAVGCGGFDGMGGIAYALARIGTLLDDEQITGYAAHAVRLAALAVPDTLPPGDLPAPAEVSMASGWAGCLSALAAVHAETGLAEAGAVARACADRLAEVVGRLGPKRLRAWAPDGFRDGALGMGSALLRFAGDPASEPHQLATGALATRALATRALGGIGRWDATITGPAWCTGTAGLLLAYAPSAAPGIDGRIDALLRQPVGRDLSLCHGEAGIADALAEMAHRGYGRRTAPARVRRAGLLLSVLSRYGPRCGVPGGVSTPGLLNGLAGIGYGLLRLGFANRVPSVLLLEPTPSR
jgi:lantibiotic modifying enzyme